MTSGTSDTASALPHMPDVPGVRHRFVDVGDGVRLHVAEAGEGEPVVLLHGFPQHWYAWRRIIPQLADGYRLICPDLRGFGWSDTPPGGYDTHTRVRDVLAVMDALGVDRARMIGHEFGGWTGFMLCLKAPERFSHYLALNIVHPWPAHHRMIPRAWRYWYTSPLEFPLLGRLVLGRMPGFTRFLLRKGVIDQKAWDPREMEEFVRSSAEPGRARAGEVMHREYALRDIAGLVLGRFKKLRLTTPTVILAGEKDFVLTPAVMAGGERHADDLRVEVVPGCGHFVHEERPELVVRTARELFARP